MEILLVIFKSQLFILSLGMKQLKCITERNVREAEL